MKRFWLAIIILILCVVISGFSSAQCCCIEDDYEWAIELTTDECTNTYNGLFHSLDSLECAQTCVPECAFLSCNGENAVFPCSCGTDIIKVDSGKFCCASNSYEKIYSTSESCIADSSCETVEVHSLSGFVYDQDSNPIQGAIVTVDNSFSKITDANGRYVIDDIPESDALTVVVGASDCVEKSETISFSQDATLDFIVSCGLVTGSCTDVSGKCCAANQECIGGSVSGQLDFASGRTCYAQCDVCTIIDVSGEGCDEGSCLTPDNAHCEDGVWKVYNLNDNDELNKYCSFCGLVDGNCIHKPCQTNGLCDGFCPAASCDSDQDPDCGLSCNITANSWCDTYGLKHVVFFDLSVQSDLDNYCSHCATKDPGDCQSECGNGKIESGEECDPGETTAFCDINCQLSIPETCGDEKFDSQYEECDSSATDLVSPMCLSSSYSGCNDDCTCERVCDEDETAPTALSLSLVPEEPAIMITWDLPNTCGNLFDKIVVKRCDGNSCTPTILGEYLPASQIFLKDESDIQPNINYTYVVGMKYKNDNTRYSGMKSITTGDDDCMKPHKDAFCVLGKKDLFKCDEDLEYASKSECAGYCFITSPDNDDICIGSGECDRCSSLYGMYSEFALSLPASYENWFVSFKESPETDFESKSCVELTIENVCFSQRTNKSVDVLDSCANVTSCYDYKSESLCDGNPCGKFNEEEYECEWTDYDSGSDFKLGVCSPNTVEEQNCSFCKTNNPIFPVCDKELCGLFGTCYFSELNNYYLSDDGYPDCKGLLDTSCRDYDNEEDCEGEQHFTLNADNSDLTTGNDFFGFGKCKWDDGKRQCYKDADDNADHVPNSQESNIRDCLLEDFVCQTDFE
ncbi:MAG: carboxypeptidase-like regulatory domain-containing protein, partial [Nanoarchaeota archaeon]|nr:carboxypeptidase-like regulatory domain-containing protein [Nanoarchaeota archaeon]